MGERAAAATQPRARGAVRLVAGGRVRTAIRDLYQSGSLKLLFPRGPGRSLQAVAVNTAGGVTGGDRFSVEARVGDGARLTLTTQAAERAYKAAKDSPPGIIGNRLEVGDGARLDWLPQETILFQGCHLDRRLTLDLHGSAEALVVEPLVFGRLAMGEVLTSARLRDRIEVRRDGRLVYLDSIALGPDMAAQLARGALGAGARAVATVVLASPRAEAWLGDLRGFLPASAGASLVRDDILCARILASDGFALRSTLIPLLSRLSGEDIPRPWMI